MPHKQVNETIITIIYKMITAGSLDTDEVSTVKKWMKRSVYYRSLLEDISTDQQLKNKLLQAYTYNKEEFWKILITYRAALHNGMPAREGNFWERILRILSFKK